MDSQSDRNIVQVFSKDSNGNESLIAILLAIPDYTAPITGMEHESRCLIK